MDELLKTALSQAPGLVVLVILVRLFLKRDEERDVLMRQLHSEHLSARVESRTAIQENTSSNKEVTRAITTLVEQYRQGP